MKKFIAITAFVFFMTSQLLAPVALAQGTLLPKTDPEGCDILLKDIELTTEKNDKGQKMSPKEVFVKYPAKTKNDILGCAIMTGRVSFWMIPYFIVYIIEFLIGISGLIAILFVVIGGYQFIISGATDQRDSAKTTIRNAILGLILVLTAWVIVNVLQFVLTF